MTSKNNWTRDEHILAFNLYCKIPFSKINSSFEPVKKLAMILGRTKGSVAMKLANFARLDPALRERNIKGLSQGAKGEADVWKEFNGNWESLAIQSEQLLATYKNEPLELSSGIATEDIIKEGEEREAIIKARIGQNFFRSGILASYDGKCCITGLAVPELLVASHIIPWSDKKEFRLNLNNGLCLNALHDKAFDRGLMTITPDYIIRFSDILLEKTKKIELDTLFLPYHNNRITLPQKFFPLREFLEYHNQNVFLL